MGTIDSVIRYKAFSIYHLFDFLVGQAIQLHTYRSYVYLYDSIDNFHVMLRYCLFLNTREIEKHIKWQDSIDKLK